MFPELLQKDDSVTIRQPNLQVLATETVMQKMIYYSKL